MACEGQGRRPVSYEEGLSSACLGGNEGGAGVRSSCDVGAGFIVGCCEAVAL